MTEAQKPPRELAELYVSIGLPLDELGQLGSEWKRGPWLLAGGDWREFDEAARVEPFLNTTPLQAMQTRRRHRVLGADLATLVPDTSADADGIVVAAAEVVEAPKLTSTAPTAYLLLHMEVTAGTRGGLAAAVKMLARLSRPGWTESQKLVRAVLAGARLHRGRVRGLTLSLVLAGEDRLADSHEELLGRLTALRKDATDPGGWLGEDLLLGDVRARVGTSAVALALNGPGARPLVGTVRAHLLDSLILGLIQQDQLLGLSGELPRGSAVQLAKRFDRFRREWWWQVLVEAEEVSPLYDAWLRVSGTEAHMQQLTTHLDAVRSADRARTAEVIAWAAVALSVMALVLQLAGWLT